MTLHAHFNSKTLPNGDVVTTFTDGSSLTVYGDSGSDGHRQGEKIWRNAKGQIHRDGGPAIEWPEGHKEWRRNGQLHREDGPAIERPASGNHEYWQEGIKRDKTFIGGRHFSG